MPTATTTDVSTGTASQRYTRPKHDFYATQSKSVEAVLDKEKFKGNILEPCCGVGSISEVLKNHKYKTYSNDLINRGYGETFKDFLKDDFQVYDNVITNPPFKYAKQFIEKSLKITRRKVAMFCRVQLLEGVSRLKLFQNTPLKKVYVFSNRQVPYHNGLKINPRTGKKWAGTLCFAWFVWEHGYQGKPTIDWLTTN